MIPDLCELVTRPCYNMSLLCDCQLFLDQCIKLITLLALWEKQQLWVSCFNSPFLNCSCERTTHSVAHSGWTPFTKWTNHSVGPIVGGACCMHVWISALLLTGLMNLKNSKTRFSLVSDRNWICMTDTRQYWWSCRSRILLQVLAPWVDPQCPGVLLICVWQKATCDVFTICSPLQK